MSVSRASSKTTADELSSAKTDLNRSREEQDLIEGRYRQQLNKYKIVEKQSHDKDARNQAGILRIAVIEKGDLEKSSRIAVLEKENREKDARIKTLETQVSAAHETLAVKEPPIEEHPDALTKRERYFKRGADTNIEEEGES